MLETIENVYQTSLLNHFKFEQVRGVIEIPAQLKELKALIIAFPLVETECQDTLSHKFFELEKSLKANYC